jgi:hypothetical protein
VRLLHDVALLVAQATPTPTPDPLNVHLVDEGKEWWKDWIVPVTTLAAAFGGGIGGVVIGGRMNRTTLRTLETERSGREDARDVAHAGREDKREEAKAERELAAERRLALGSLRLAIDDISLAISDLDHEAERQGDNPVMDPDTESPSRVRPEDKHAIAMWMSDRTWTALARTLARVEARSGRRHEAREQIAKGRLTADDYRAEAAQQAASLRTMLAALQPSLESLEGDPKPTPSTKIAREPPSSANDV